MTTGTWVAGWRLAVGSLTVVRVRPPGEITRPVAGVAMLLGPLVAVLVTLPAAGAGQLAALAGLPPTAAGLIVVGVLALATRGLHLDGLADTADGLAASFEVDRALAVMRRGDVGPAGAVTLIVVLGLQAVLAGELFAGPYGWLVVAAAFAAGRAALALGTLRGVPPARTEGLGAAVAGSVPWSAAAAAWLAVAGGLAALAAVAGRPWWGGAAALPAALAAAGVLLSRCRRRLGGITGDVLGALVEVAALTVLVVMQGLGG